MKSYDVSSVCNALVDIVYPAHDQLLSEFKLNKGNTQLVDSKTQKQLIDSIKNSPETVEIGGSSLNAIRTLAGLKKKTFFYGAVAEDHFGSQIRDRLAQLQINDKMMTSSQESTGTCLVLVTPDKERTMATYLGASRHFTADQLPLKQIADSAILHICGYQWDTEAQKIAIMAAIEHAKANGCQVSFDVADPFVVNINAESFRQVIKKYADVVFANEEESKLLYNLSAEETVKEITNNDAIAVIKLGAKGALIGHKNEMVKIDAVKTNVVDTTAAGDMFAAGFLYGLTSSCSLKQCGELAAILAADVISRYGATVSNQALSQVMSIVESQNHQASTLN